MERGYTEIENNSIVYGQFLNRCTVNDTVFKCAEF